ncbi:MAG: hypothetical protein JST54_11165 [Deltaproteobacteria bacterium]|nr:hypothetical protein [Deltaproteobacteria bacterium]
MSPRSIAIASVVLFLAGCGATTGNEQMKNLDAQTEDGGSIHLGTSGGGEGVTGGGKSDAGHAGCGELGCDHQADAGQPVIDAGCDSELGCGGPVDAGCDSELGCGGPVDAGCDSELGCGGNDAGTNECIDGASCITDCGSTGTWSCSENVCQPPAETCGNGADDDCNGLVDCDDPACANDSTCIPSCEDGASCSTDCGSTGSWSCSENRCVPPAEICGNGRDDDCNGLADCDDPACAGTSECCGQPTVCGVIGCNGDMGQNNIEDKDTAPCWQDPGACTPENLDAWCTRRGDTDYLWPNLVQQSVVDNCADGDVTDVSPIPGEGFGDQFQCIVNSCVTYTCNTPLVLAFEPAKAVAYLDDDGASSFDLSSAQDGSGARHDWPTSVTPWLALDRDGDGKITSGRELFGSATLVNGKPARDGFEALAALDANHDGVLDARDPDFKRLVVWTDTNGDRRSTPDELKPLSAFGVKSIRVNYHIAPRCDAHGNCEVERAGFMWRDAKGHAHQGEVVDVHLKSRGATLAAR